MPDTPPHPPATPPSPEPFFLCGFGKSGTNRVGNLLNLHPEIRCDGEWHFQHFFRAWDEFSKYPWQLGSRQPARAIARAGVERLIGDCLATLAEGRPGVRLVGDRSPRPLRELVRGSKTIYVLRDGRDVVVSYTFHHLRAGEAHHFPKHLRESFTRHQRAFRADPGAMSPQHPGLLGDEAWVRETARFWAGRVLEDRTRGAGTDPDAGSDSPAAGSDSPAALLTIRYERLHADVAAECRRMYTFLGVDPARATPPDQSRRTAPGFGKTDPASENRKSLYRKGAVGDWKRFATPEFTRWLQEEAGEALEQLGYRW
ncbi:MAG: sulfotransferase domain-containing protein [Planctomycetota bacterium]|nr:sulfotransferase domain-containing protein [Planctomycetota bacterium]